MWRLALNPDRTATLAELAEETEVPRSFLAKILQQLVSAKIVRSFRGAKGGFRLARPPEEVSLYEVYREMEGPRAAESQCAVTPSTCGVEGYCTLHPFWHGARQRFEELLRRARPGEAGPLVTSIDHKPIET